MEPTNINFNIDRMRFYKQPFTESELMNSLQEHISHKIFFVFLNRIWEEHVLLQNRVRQF